MIDGHSLTPQQQMDAPVAKPAARIALSVSFGFFSEGYIELAAVKNTGVGKIGDLQLF